MSPPRPDPIYLDHNTTAPMLPEVADFIHGCWRQIYGNPASQHSFGRRARQVLEAARTRISYILGLAANDRLVFTSGGTEANNLAIRGLLQRDSLSSHPGNKRVHLIISAIEHPSITELARQLQCDGHEVDMLPASSQGTIRVECLEDLLHPNTAVVAAIKGQNETGVLQPIAELAAICAEHNVPLHTDAVQVAGKIPIDFRATGAATMAIAAHKFHGPLGIGALAIRHDVEVRPQLFGGFQQAGLRPGTESVALVVGMCRALELGYPDIDIETQNQRMRERAERMLKLRDRFERAIIAGWPDAEIVGARAERLPHTSNIAFVGLERQMLFVALDQAGVACSTGSACASGSSEPSPVLMAMGCDPAVVASALRFSLGATTTEREVDEASSRILACCKDLRRQKER